MEEQSWVYNEMVHVGTDYDNIEEVEKYDKKMSSIRDIESEIRDILEAVRPASSQRLIEFGCGTGEFSIAASEYYKEVCAVDISKVMLEYAQKKAQDRGRDNITYVQSGFLQFNNDGPLFDAAVSQVALHHLPDFWKLVALKKINAVLHDKAKFYLRDVVFSFNPEKYEKSINYIINSTTEQAGPDVAAAFERHIRAEYSTYDWIMEEMLYRAGFVLEQADYHDEYMAVYVCSKDASIK
ncbi:MAG: class I SAM-dependent methyltransferase [bacterium]|nr:class I SAM-dependent methyltransferase [bacterium]